MSVHCKRDWRVADVDREQAAAIAEALGIPRILAHLLAGRGIHDPERAAQFLKPSAARISDPMQFQDMDKAVARLQRARDRQERVLVFGDYDVDGIVGTSILAAAFRRYGIDHVGYAMPDRVTEGYGINPGQVARAHDDGVTLIVTTDNGIAAFDAIEAANERNLDVIITDHHPPADTLPPAYAVINPKRHDDAFPARDYCGAGVAFKLAWALTGEPADHDLAALATVADMVPLVGENRDLVATGLAAMANNPRPGLLALAHVAGLKLRALKATDIAFQLAPRINAAGRLGDGTVGVRLLLAESRAEAQPLAKALDDANTERRAIEDTMHKQALKALESHFKAEQRSIVLASEKWHAGVVGIVASRIQSTYYRPVVLVAFDETGIGRGSARSVDGLNVADALGACADHLETYGGHAAAAGMSIRRDAYDTFKGAFETAAGGLLPAGDLLRPLAIDAQVALTDIDAQLVKHLARLDPVGIGNPSPVFCAYGVSADPASLRDLRGGHMRMRVVNGAAAHAAIGFRMGDRLPDIAKAGNLDVAFTPEFNEWRGEVTLQLNLKDIRTHS